MAGRPNPSLQRRRLARELRRLREVANLTLDQVASQLECSIAKLSRIETGQNSVGVRDLRDMLALYEVPATAREDLLQMAREGQRYQRWQDYRDLPFATLVGYVAEAESIRSFDVVLVPGLLQIREYAQAVVRTQVGSEFLGEIERHIDLRMLLRSALTENSLTLSAILDEAVLRRAIGGPDVMRRQLEHLLDVAGLPNVTLQMLPFSVGEHRALDGGFMIIGFPQPSDADTVYLSSLTERQFVDSPDAVSHYESAFQHLENAALKPAATIDYIAALARDLF